MAGLGGAERPCGADELAAGGTAARGAADGGGAAAGGGLGQPDVRRAADRCGVERGVPWVGGSVILGPEGYPLAGPVAADREALLVARVDLHEARTKTISAHNHVLTDRRPDLYARLVALDD